MSLLKRIKGLLEKQYRQFQSDKVMYMRISQYLHPYRGRFVIGLLASIPASALEGLTAFFSGPFLDRLIKGGGDYSFMFYIPLLIIGVSLLQGMFEYVSQYCTTYVGNRISMDIQTQLFQHLLKMDLGYYKANSYGEITTRYLSDSKKLQMAINSNLQGLLIQFFTLIFLAAVLIYRNWQLSIIALSIISLIVIPMAYISNKIRQLDFKSQKAVAAIGNLFNETIYGVREVTSFALSPFMMRRFHRVRHEVFDTTMDTAKKNILLPPIMQFIASVGIGVIIFIGIMYVQQGRMTPGDLMSFLLALLLLYKPVKVIGSTIGKISVIMAPAERVFQVLDTKPALPEPEAPAQVGPFETLEFRDADFAYKKFFHKKKNRPPEVKEVLHDINLTIRAGETIGIMGPSGGGKSTLLDLMSRFIDPTGGQVLMNNVDLRDMDLYDLRSRISMVSQETMLFEGSIRENILLGRLDATEEELQESLRVAHLEGWVSSLPEGLNTPVGDRGSFLSGGQKQRIAIARAYLKRTPILILDEATSALDNESEAIVQNALMNLMKDRTVIIVAHRLSTIRHADRILVIEDGQLAETGTHDELMTLQGIYYNLYLLQFRKSEQTLLGHDYV